MDEKVTGGYGTVAVTKGSELLNTGTGYVSDKIQMAKQAADSAGDVQPVDESNPNAELAGI